MNKHIGLDDPNLPGLSDPIDKPWNSEITCMFVDMRNSAGQKFEKSTMAWLSEFLKMFRILDECRAGMQVLSVSRPMGDGGMVVVDSDHAHQLLNMGIEFMERITEAASAKDGHPIGEIDIAMSIGFATGSAFRYRLEEGGVDHLSPVCDRASRLCSAASAHAILVDGDTVDAANMRSVHSKLGIILHRTPEEYRGPRERVPLQGIPDPVEYHEIFYGASLFGLRASAVTEVTRTPRAASVSSAPAGRIVVSSTTAASQPPPAGAAAGQRVGRVKQWFADRGFGFITDLAGTDFHISSRAVFYEDDVECLSSSGTEVVFLTAPPAREGQTARAVNVLVAGQRADGVIRTIHPERPFGFIEVTDDRNHRMSFHFHVSDEMRKQFKVGNEVSFEVAVNPKGGRAIKIEQLVDDAPSVAA
ncbi:adenylate/guanylate cyclase domain-containing protein [Nocardia sp. NPDC059239]|uniref:adenylate/guanylate cyclase domain-containing protein n=1 Tax=unclassified Nocardia TaxID=2637762 RepID=UPI00367B5C17